MRIWLVASAVVSLVLIPIALAFTGSPARLHVHVSGTAPAPRPFAGMWGEPMIPAPPSVPARATRESSSDLSPTPDSGAGGDVSAAQVPDPVVTGRAEGPGSGSNAQQAPNATSLLGGAGSTARHAVPPVPRLPRTPRHPRLRPR
ncbi:MAG: hypothetical protein ACYDAY_10305 [Candidatus Dormibacteria bacterium]